MLCQKVVPVESAHKVAGGSRRSQGGILRNRSASPDRPHVRLTSKYIRIGWTDWRPVWGLFLLAVGVGGFEGSGGEEHSESVVGEVGESSSDSAV